MLKEQFERLKIETKRMTMNIEPADLKPKIKKDETAYEYARDRIIDFQKSGKLQGIGTGLDVIEELNYLFDTMIYFLTVSTIEREIMESRYYKIHWGLEKYEPKAES